MGLRVEADDAVLEGIGDVERAIGSDGDVMHAVEDGRCEVLGLSRSRWLRALGAAVPADAGDGMDLAVEDFEDLVGGRELDAVEFALRIEVDAEGFAELVGAGCGQDFHGRQRQGGEAEQGEEGGAGAHGL